MSQEPKIYVAGHRGMVGSAIVRHLEKNVIASEARHSIQIITRTHAELDLTQADQVEAFFATEKPTQVYLAAAKVGGIVAINSYPGEFIRDNLAIQTNVIHSAWRHGVQRLLFLGSSCIYPRDCPQPIREDYLLTGPLEQTNQPYALAKITGIEMCWSYNRQYGTRYMAVMPTNLYGPGDNYHPENSHVIPALLRRAHESKLRGDTTFTVWGTGTPMREFLYCEDMAEACVHVMNLDDATYSQLLNDQQPPLLNIGTGQDITIAQLAQAVCDTVGLQAELVFDTSKPDGSPRKLMDSSRLNALGWQAQVGLEAGIAAAHRDFLSSSLRG
jgi:GDP-L-fucose synthase